MILLTPEVTTGTMRGSVWRWPCLIDNDKIERDSGFGARRTGAGRDPRGKGNTAAVPINISWYWRICFPKRHPNSRNFGFADYLSSDNSKISVLLELLPSVENDTQLVEYWLTVVSRIGVENTRSQLIRQRHSRRPLLYIFANAGSDTELLTRAEQMHQKWEGEEPNEPEITSFVGWRYEYEYINWSSARGQSQLSDKKTVSTCGPTGVGGKFCTFWEGGGLKRSTVHHSASPHFHAAFSQNNQENLPNIQN